MGSKAGVGNKSRTHWKTSYGAVMVIQAKGDGGLDIGKWRGEERTDIFADGNHRTQG